MGCFDHFTGHLMSQDSELAMIEQGRLIHVLDPDRLSGGITETVHRHPGTPRPLD